MHNFSKLKIWEESMDLAQTIYETCQSFPKQETYGLISQMQRAAVSIASNIAEGAGRSTDKEFAYFLSIAVGSTFELHTQILLSERFGYIDNNETEILVSKVNTLQRQIIAFKQKIEHDPTKDVF